MLWVWKSLIFVFWEGLIKFYPLFITLPIHCFSVPGYMSHSSQSLQNSTSQKSPDNPPLPPRTFKKPPHPLPFGSVNNNNNSSSNILSGGSSGTTHTRTTSDPETDIPYVLHRRTPSEPPPRPLPLETRNTISIPFSMFIFSSVVFGEKTQRIAIALAPSLSSLLLSSCKIL